MRAIIAGAGGAAHLPGMLAAKTTVPVLGVPVASRHLSGQDSLYSIVQMPAGVPVATFAIGEAGATNAALFAVSLLAADDAALATRLDAYRADRREQAAASGAPAPVSRHVVGRSSRRRRRSGCSAAGSSAGTRSSRRGRWGTARMVLEPDPRAPAGAVADEHLVAAYDDEAALDRLASACAVVTTEFENPPAASLERLAARRPSRRRRRRWRSRRTGGPRSGSSPTTGIPVGPWGVVESADDRPDVGFPAILKTARLGYDGKGQTAIASIDQHRRRVGWLGGRAVRARAGLALETEVSVVVARTADGRTATYEVSENHHVDGMLDLTVVPARVAGPVAERATELALAIADALDYVGVLAVELFVVDGELYVNELAPRPHNSGHWTLDAARTSQFEQQVRAVCGVGLGATTMTAPAVAMVNLLGDLWQRGEPEWAMALAEPRASLHLYGKAIARPGRKMGHLTVTGGSAGRRRRRSVRAPRRDQPLTLTPTSSPIA